MQEKWRSLLPISTPVTTLTKGRFRRFKERYRSRKSYSIRQGLAVGTDHDVELLAAACGWFDLTASARRLAEQSTQPDLADPV